MQSKLKIFGIFLAGLALGALAWWGFSGRLIAPKASGYFF